MLSKKPQIHPTAILEDCRLGEWTEVGAHVHMAETDMDDYSYVVAHSQIIYASIGKFCSIASFARLNPGNHPLDRAALHHFTYRSRQFEMGEDDPSFFEWRRRHKVALGHDVWIGHGAVVLPGVNIGTGAAIGAGAVATRDVAPFQVAAGVPAKPIRDRFPKDVQDALLRISWWDWPHEKLKEAMNDFRNYDAREFAKKYDPE